MPSHFRRVIWIVLDSVGIGSMPDAASYGDEESDTLGHTAAHMQAQGRPLRLPNLCRLGLANIRPFSGLLPVPEPAGAYGRCALLSPGKDTTTGHWEMAGIILGKPFPVYPQGFPPEVMQSFEAAIARGTLGNKPASGTEIIQELGAEHVATGKPIVYTSADSVFQIAAHEQVIPIPDLYEMCYAARKLLTGPHEVGRVIARPFTGSAPHFTRTPNRKDLAVPPPAGMLLDKLAERAVPVAGIGKISDVFLGRGIGTSTKTKDNADGMAQTVAAMAKQTDGLIWVNLVDFDQFYGHRNDVEGYARALEAVDEWLPALPLEPGDLLVITADHGCDPTTPSTDHSREYTPLLLYGEAATPGIALGTRTSLADIGQTIAANFGVSISAGTSFLPEIARQKTEEGIVCSTKHL